MLVRPSARLRGLLVSLLLALGLAAAAPQVQVAPDLGDVFGALADAYPGARPQAVEAGAQLVLERGEVALRDVDRVVVVPGVTLTLLADDADARAFQRFATSAAGQRALIAAGLLPGPRHRRRPGRPRR
jgi:hypothetical protein